MLRVTLKDATTGEIQTYPDTDIGVWGWTEGNWSCDCNRVLAFYKEIPDWDSPCEGKRYIVVAAQGDLEGMAEEDFISECNREYCDESL